MRTKNDKKIKQLLSTPINQLPLSIDNSPLKKYIKKLYKELGNRRIKFKPGCYLSDEWGCPHKVPVIGIPFYLADTTLSRLEQKFTGIKAESPKEIMMYLRHETGHALNYGYRLFRSKRWQEIFGKFSRPYKNKYRRVPNHKSFVLHLPDWYAQKHPDEDFAETFAVWLAPESDWKKRYKKTPALKKLLYVREIINKCKGRRIKKINGKKDKPVERIKITLKEWYRQNRAYSK